MHKEGIQAIPLFLLPVFRYDEYGMKKYKNVIFDLYGTLIDIRTDETSFSFWRKVRALLREYGADYKIREVRDLYFALIRVEGKKRSGEDCPEIELRAIFREIFQRKGVEMTEEEIDVFANRFRQASYQRFGLYPGVTELLEYLKEQGVRVILLSNAQECFTMKELEETGLLPYLNDIFLSSAYGCAKPSKRFFEIMIGKTGIDVSESVMVGNDYKSDMLGAAKVNLDGIYIHQVISSEIKGEFPAVYKIMNGNVREIQSRLKSHVG